MASKRRGGLRPPELRGTLGTLIRTTTGVVRDAIERGAREGRARLDDARAGRRRQDALADLGELVLDLIRRGEIDLAELPEARDLVRQLDELDADDDPAPPPPRSVRRRFDDRPPASAVAAAAAAAARDDGTVSSGIAERAMRPTKPATPKPETSSTRAPTRPLKSWPSPTDDAPAAAAPAPAPAAARRPPLPTGPHRKGGISFDDDDDLGDYMHPDDVPPRPPAKDPGDHEA
ncbi:MAG TPA: hypothetical protein VGD37_24580 [Kofleriaceae bacterium]